MDSLFNCNLALNKSKIHSDCIIDDINYKYLPQGLILPCSKIYLFKANKYVEKEANSEDMYKFFKYYVDETECNHLTSILKQSSELKIQKLDSNHYSWVNNQNDINKICSVIIKGI